MATISSSTQPPHIFLLGATGRTGTILATEALRRGHTLTALVRDIAKAKSILPSSPSLHLVAGKPCDANSLKSILTDPSIPHGTVIVSTLGQTRRSGNPWATTTSPPGFMAESIEAVISAVSKKDIRSKISKIITMSTFGVGNSFSNLNFVMRLIMNHSNMQQTVDDHNLVHQALINATARGVLEGVEVVQVRASMLKEADAMPVKVVGDEGDGIGYWPSVTVRSVVEFIMDVAVAERGVWNGRTPVITN